MVIALIFDLSTMAFGQTTGQVQYNIASGSGIWFDATSTLHGFSAKSTSIIGTVIADTTLRALPAVAVNDSICNVTATIPVRTLNSGEKGLDNNMYKAMKADKYPNIEFKLTSAKAVPAANSAEKGVPFRTTGYLTIAGKQKEVRKDALLTRASQGKVRLTGSKSIVMSGYGIKPPTALWGLIKANDKLTVHFRLIAARDSVGNSPLRTYEAVAQGSNSKSRGVDGPTTSKLTFLPQAPGDRFG